MNWTRLVRYCLVVAGVVLPVLGAEVFQKGTYSAFPSKPPEDEGRLDDIEGYEQSSQPHNNVYGSLASRLHKNPLPRREALPSAHANNRHTAAGGLPSFLSKAQQYRNDGELAITTLRGQIKKHGSHDEVPAFRIFFEGKESKSNSEGFFSFPVELGHLDIITLVITKTIGHHFDKTNTIKHEKIVPDKNYRVFTYSKTDGLRWTLKEDTDQMHKTNFVIPEKSSVIMLLDPKYVHTLQPWDLVAPEKTLHLPSIVLKHDLEAGKVERASVKSLLSSLDHTPFREPLKERDHPEVKNPKIEVTLSH